MPLQLHVTVDGEPAISFALQRGADSLENIEKYWPPVADVVYGIVAEQFATEGARGGDPWAQHSEAYRRARLASEFPSLRKNYRETQPILIRTGALLKSLVHRDAEGSIYEATPDSLTVGSSLPYAILHQRGTSKMPARPEYVFKATDGQKMRRAFRDEVAKVVTRSGWTIEEGAFDFWGEAANAGNLIDEDVSMF